MQQMVAFFNSFSQRIAKVYNDLERTHNERKQFNKSISNYGLNYEKFYSLKRLMCYDEEDEDDDNESTFSKLEHVTKLGLKPSNENFWPTIKSLYRNKRVVVPL